MTVTCGWCDSEVEKPDKEVRRRRKQGHHKFFCNVSCAARYNNSIRPKRRVLVERRCEDCGESFTSHNGTRAPRFCSRSCASRGSVTPYRSEVARRVALESANLIHGVEAIAAGLRAREAWKYAEVEKRLKDLGIRFQFEYPLESGNCIFDLALLDENLFVEFDEPYHDTPGQKKVDREKDKAAKEAGWRVVRLGTDKGKVIPPDVLKPVLN